MRLERYWLQSCCSKKWEQKVSQLGFMYQHTHFRNRTEMEVLVTQGSTQWQQYHGAKQTLKPPHPAIAMQVLAGWLTDAKVAGSIWCLCEKSVDFHENRCTWRQEMHYFHSGCMEDSSPTPAMQTFKDGVSSFSLGPGKGKKSWRFILGLP